MRGGRFLGRSEEQARLREVIGALTSQTAAPYERLAYVVLVYGRGGIGKTRLLQRFGEIVTTEAPSVALARIAWEVEREQRLVEFAYGRDHAPVIVGTIEACVRELPHFVDEDDTAIRNAVDGLRNAWERGDRADDSPTSSPSGSDDAGALMDGTV